MPSTPKRPATALSVSNRMGKVTGTPLSQVTAAALSLAGVCGPVAVNYLRQAQISRGISAGQAYDMTLFIMAALLVVGFFCNLAIKPVYRPDSVPVETTP